MCNLVILGPTIVHSGFAWGLRSVHWIVCLSSRFAYQGSVIIIMMMMWGRAENRYEIALKGEPMMVIDRRYLITAYSVFVFWTTTPTRPLFFSVFLSTIEQQYTRRDVYQSYSGRLGQYETSTNEIWKWTHHDKGVKKDLWASIFASRTVFCLTCHSKHKKLRNNLTRVRRRRWKKSKEKLSDAVTPPRTSQKQTYAAFFLYPGHHQMITHFPY